MYPVQRPKIGFLVKDVSSSELAYNILRKGSDADIDTFIFFEQIARPCISSLVPCSHVSEAFIFDGPLVATCLQTANKLIQMYSSTRKYFFLNDLEWMRIPFQMKQFEQIEPVYRNKELSLICRSQSHKKLTELTWNRKVSMVVERYNFYDTDVLKQLCNGVVGIYPKGTECPIIYKNSVL